MQPICPQCGHHITKSPASKFLSLRKTYECERCHYEGVLPLRNSTKILWWTVVFMVISLVAYSAFTGRTFRLGLLGLIAPYLLVKDWLVEKKATQYRKAHKLKGPVPRAKEPSWLLKGILFSLLFIGVSLGLQYWADQLRASLKTNQSTATTSSALPRKDVMTILITPDGTFEAKFPIEPTVTAQQIPTSNGAVNETIYKAIDASAKQGFVIISQTYSNGYLRGPVIKQTLDLITESLAKYPGRPTLVSASYTTAQNYPTKDETWVMGTSHLRIRNIVIGNTIFSIQGFSNKENDSVTEQFIQSFGPGK